MTTATLTLTKVQPIHTEEAAMLARMVELSMQLQERARMCIALDTDETRENADWKQVAVWMRQAADRLDRLADSEIKRDVMKENLEHTGIHHDAAELSNLVERYIRKREIA